jgi:hypothetical protein
MDEPIPIVPQTLRARSLALPRTGCQECLDACQDLLQILACLESIASTARRCIEEIDFRGLGAILKVHKSEARAEFTGIDAQAETRAKRRSFRQCREGIVKPRLLRAKNPEGP